MSVTNLSEILKRVQKPGRYIGEETNIVRKKVSPDMVSLAFAFPDLYEVGMSYLGLRILYHLVNEMDDAVCERVFAPWPDMEKELRDSGLKLYTLESKREVREFDIVGFSLSYELSYTNVLNMLDLAGITVLADKRADDEPLVIAGGACCYNPEPMAAFIDIFFIGDAEETLPLFIEKYREIKRKGLTRKEKLLELASLPGLYIPALYRAKYSGGKFVKLEKLAEKAPASVKKNMVADLNASYYPLKQITPLIEVPHDRIVVEIMRGCPNSCRFCQAGSVNNPVRLRSAETVRRLCRDTYAFTGCEQITLLSLSSVNYPYLTDLVRDIAKDFRGKGVSVSIPSLRPDEAFYGLPEVISEMKKTALTFAPESATPDIQRAIGKITDYDVLAKSASLAYERGWNRIKLYFMVGFPVDIEEECSNIAAWSKKLSNLRRSPGKGPAQIRVSVNSLIPKPHTPFQWLGMRDEATLLRGREYFFRCSDKNVKFDFNDINKSLLEAAFARGDRSVADVIHTAWKKGARMDGWSDYFDFSLWENAFAQCGHDLRQSAYKHFHIDDPLPWEHIRTAISPERLKNEYAASGFCPGKQ